MLKKIQRFNKFVQQVKIFMQGTNVYVEQNQTIFKFCIQEFEGIIDIFTILILLVELLNKLSVSASWLRKR